MKIYLKITYELGSVIDVLKDLEFRAKNTNILDCWFVDEDNVSVDITGATVYFSVKEKAVCDSGDVSILKELSGDDLTDAANGNVLIELTPTDTDELLGSYLYSIEIELLDERIYTVAEGIVVFRKNIREEA